jgi:hypothetical protein
MYLCILHLIQCVPSLVTKRARSSNARHIYANKGNTSPRFWGYAYMHRDTIRMHTHKHTIRMHTDTHTNMHHSHDNTKNFVSGSWEAFPQRLWLWDLLQKTILLTHTQTHYLCKCTYTQICTIHMVKQNHSWADRGKHLYSVCGCGICCKRLSSWPASRFWGLLNCVPSWWRQTVCRSKLLPWSMCVCMYVYMYVCVFVCMERSKVLTWSMYACMHARMHVCMYVCYWINILAHMHTCIVQTSIY